jgi:hypothetical protein
MKKATRLLNRIAMFIGYITLTYFVVTVIHGNLYRYQEVDPYKDAGIGAREVIAEEYSQRSIHGDGVSMVIWSASPTTAGIERLVDPQQIERGHIWFAGPFDANARAAFDWLTGAGEYAVIREHVEQIMSDRFFYAIDRLNLQGNSVYNASIWIVSPEHRLIAYMDRDT